MYKIPLTLWSCIEVNREIEVNRSCIEVNRDRGQFHIISCVPTWLPNASIINSAPALTILQGYSLQQQQQQQSHLPQQQRQLQGPSAGTYDRMADDIERLQLGEQEYARWVGDIIRWAAIPSETVESQQIVNNI